MILGGIMMVADGSLLIEDFMGEGFRWSTITKDVSYVGIGLSFLLLGLKYRRKKDHPTNQRNIWEAI
jgi:hypothetical protein